MIGSQKEQRILLKKQTNSRLKPQAGNNFRSISSKWDSGSPFVRQC